MQRWGMRGAGVGVRKLGTGRGEGQGIGTRDTEKELYRVGVIARRRPRKTCSDKLEEVFGIINVSVREGSKHKTK